MEGRNEGLERFSPVSDERLLLAIGRAWDHRHPDHPRLLHRSQIAKHLGFVHNGNTTRNLNADLEAAVAVRGTPIDELVHSETTSAQIRRIGCRLMWSFNLFATGVYCLFEWKEPKDAERDAASTTTYSVLGP